jgi:hypothetical protein
MNDEKFELNTLVEVAASDGMMEAQIIKAKLDNFEVPCMLKFEAVGRVLGITTDGLGRVQVMVPLEFKARALEIIAIEEFEEDNDDDEKDNKTH